MHTVTLPIDDTVKLEEMQFEDDTEDDHGDKTGLLENEPATSEVVVVTRSTSSRNSNTNKVTPRQIITTLILFLVNLLNYMDRFTVAGVLPKIKTFYGGKDGITNAEAGLLQTSFIIFYMVFSPIFGFLGDRVNRTVLMSIGILAWSLVTFVGSWVPSNMFWLFVIMRGLVGIGEASYSTIAPTIISDLFKGDARTKALTVFYFAIPVGSGLGYIVGSFLARLFNDWQYALRFTPLLGLVCAFLIFFVVKEPERGMSEGVSLQSSMSISSWLDDILYLLKNKTFMLSTGGFTSVAFVAGALSFWAPTFINYASQVFGSNESLSSISFKFGIITVIAGIVGVLSGTQSARWLRSYYPYADPLVCAFGLLMCAPFLFFALYLSSYNAIVTWLCIFIGSTMLCLNWAVATDILLYVVIPTRRSTGEAFQILVGHTFGDAGSPYLVGVVSDSIKNGNNSALANYFSLQYALYMMAFVAVIGGGFYLAAALFVVEDKSKADAVIHAAQVDPSNSSPDDGEDEEDDNPGLHGNSINIETSVVT